MSDARDGVLTRCFHSLLLPAALLWAGAGAAFAQSAAGPVVLTRFEIGEAYYDEAPSDLVGSRSWLGLYLGEEGSFLAETAVDFVPEPDGAYTVYQLTGDPPGPHLLFSGVEPLSPGPATTVVAWPASLSEDGASVEVSLGGADYRVRLEADDPYLCDAVVWLEVEGRAQRLYAPEQSAFSCDEPHFDVDWAGDLDRDGKLDLVVSFSSKYSHHPRLLLLSSAAADDEIVGAVALFERFAG